MREFVFTVEYEAGEDPLMDVFINHPKTHARTINCHVSEQGTWRLERLVGPEDALEKLDEHYMSPLYCECLGEPHCQVEWHGEIIDADPGHRTIYCYRPEPGDCHSIPRLATDYLGDGILFEAERHGKRYEWRLLLQDDRDIRELYDRLESEVRDGLNLEFKRIAEPTYWTDEAITIADLPPEQRETIEAAVDHGYYETPREITLPELAEETGDAESTLQYRLQRAEEWIISHFVSHSAGSLMRSMTSGGQ